MAAEVRSQRDRTLALLEGLPDEAWEDEIVSGWRLREVVAHLIATDEAALTGRLYRLGVRRVTVEALEAWNDAQVPRWAGRPIPALLHGLDRWGRRIARAVAFGQVASRIAIPSPFGRVTPEFLGRLRVYDEWIHMEDVRRRLGLPSGDDPSEMLPVALQLLALIPIQTLPRIGAGPGGVVRIAFTDVEAPPFAVDLAARRFGGAIEGEDATIRGTAATLSMIASGRDAWKEMEAGGRLEIQGERRPAEVVLDALLAV